jgi:uncharacterized protein (TIRG00374 family)
MDDKHHQVAKLFRFRNILIPILIGFAVTGYFLLNSFDASVFKLLSWGWKSVFCLFAVLILVFLRQFAYMYRIRLLSDQKLNWRKSFDVISLWEFSSAVTPTVVGGSAVAVYFLHREKISVGRSTAIVLVATLFDELFYVIMLPLSLLITGFNQVEFLLQGYSPVIANYGIPAILLISYAVVFFLTAIIFYGVFIHPVGFKQLLTTVFSFPLLRRWKSGAVNTGDEMVITSLEFKGKKFSFWVRVFVSTVVTWSARFLVVNAIILAVLPLVAHFEVYTRQLMMWVILIITPTPGASGVAELVFSGFLGDFIPRGLGQPLALIWRLITYYPYLLLGAVVLPVWLKRVYAKNDAVQS